jgi:hypothetical protein
MWDRRSPAVCKYDKQRNGAAVKMGQRVPYAAAG